jgi:hypothetical protein
MIPIIGQKQPDIIGAPTLGLVIQCREKSKRLPNKWRLDLDGHIILKRD